MSNLACYDQQWLIIVKNIKCEQIWLYHALLLLVKYVMFGHVWHFTELSMD